MRATVDREDKTEKHLVSPGPVLPVRALPEFDKMLQVSPNQLHVTEGTGHVAQLPKITFVDP